MQRTIKNKNKKSQQTDRTNQQRRHLSRYNLVFQVSATHPLMDKSLIVQVEQN